MAKIRKNSQTTPAISIVEQGKNWRIERQRGAADYDAHIDDRGYIGSRPSPTEARMLIASYNVREAS